MATKEIGTIYIEPVCTERVEFALIGTTPYICNRMSEKVKRELIQPKGRKTAADKQANLKHVPLEEYRASPYTLPDGDSLLAVTSSAIKSAMMTAALDLPGARKTQIGRLVYVVSEYSPLFGIPKVFMCVPRSADINRTPDVRTLAILSKWAVLVSIEYVTPLLVPASVANLLSAGGVTTGIGDYRTEKGKGNYGRFRIANADDPEFMRIKAEGGRKAQEAALAEPEAYNEECARLLAWYQEEVTRRGR